MFCKKVSILDTRDCYIDKLRYHIGICDWSDFFNCAGIQYMYDVFLERLRSIMLLVYPLKINYHGTPCTLLL